MKIETAMAQLADCAASHEMAPHVEPLVQVVLTALHEANCRVQDLEAEITIKNEQRARYDDRIQAMRKVLKTVLLTCRNSDVEFQMSACLKADDKAESEMPT